MVLLSVADTNQWSTLVACQDYITKIPEEKRFESQYPKIQREHLRNVPGKRFTDEEKTEVVQKYTGGMAVLDIAAKYHCHRSAISKIFQNAGVKLRPVPRPQNAGLLPRVKR